MEQLQQLKLLLWKNFVFQKRRPLRTLFELLLPVTLACILIGIRQAIKVKSHPNGTEYPSFSISSLPPSVMANHMPQFPQFAASGWFVAFVPANVSAVDQLAAAVEDQLTPNITGKTHLTLMCQMYLLVYNSSAQNILAAVVIDHNFQRREDPLPSQVRATNNFSLTKSHVILSDNVGLSSNRNICEFCLSPLGYYAEGFLTLQHVIDQAVIKILSGQSGTLSSMSILLQRFPFPEYLDDPFIFTIQTQIPILVMLSFIFVVGSIVGSIVLEKERRQKEYMKMMSLCNWLHWNSLVSTLLPHIVSCTCVQTGVNGAVLSHSDPTLIFVFLLLFLVATIFLSFMLTTLFNRANLAAKVGVFIYFMSYVPFFFITTSYKFMTLSEKLASCILSNVGMALGAQLIGMFEGKGTGVQWDSLVEPVSIDDNFTLGHVLLMLIVDSIIYGLLAWYIEAVWPGEFGIPQPWYFFLMVSGMFRNRVLDTEQLDNTSAGGYIEADPKGLDAGISINNLHKVFTCRGKKRVAVQCLNLKMYEGHITVLLGHNGAGKSTTLSLLTGLFPPSSGTAIVSGFDILTDMPLIRRNLGLCPQHDILFNSLTTYEHLHFFAKLKGLSDQKAKEEALRILEMFQLTRKQDTNAGMLSGGMKRKLSIGIALIGGSKVLMLDEPTSGMDPVARRSVWDVLLEQRHGRTILLTTHFMEEADILGDRVAIMASGHLQIISCVGYRLVLMKTPRCEENIVERLVRHHVPSARLHNQAGAELSFLLPKEESLFGEMEMRRNELGIAGYGASVTTMEEVFLKGSNGFAIAFNLMYGLATLASSFSLLLVAEHTSKAKHLQFVSGASPFAYWLSALFCDFLTFLLTSCLILASAISMSAHQAILTYITFKSLIPLYMHVNIFSVPTMAFVVLFIFNILTGTASFLLVFILSSPGLDLKHAADILDWLFLLLPNYCLGQAVNSIYQNYKFLGLCTQNIHAELYCKIQGYVYQRSYIAWEKYGVGRYLVFMAAEGLIYCIMVILFEYNFFCVNRLNYLPRVKQSTTGSPEDDRKERIEDVEKERDRILNTPFSELPDCLVLHDLYKVYPGDPPVVAVAGLSLGISGGECFGLLGFNGAGKTTTFKMLTGDVKPTAGDAFLQGYSIHSDRKQTRHRIGYCPQFDALFDHMTARETLYFYAGLRGLHKQDAFEQVEGALHDLLLVAHANKLVQTYSGGTKRKLSTAVALMGRPPVVFLDEPSTGMDPVARHQLWDVLGLARLSGQAVVLTSHSMEECEALCTRLAIMVNGQFHCLGNTQQLKNTYGSGYTLLIKLRSPVAVHGLPEGDADTQHATFKAFMKSIFPGSCIKDEHQCLLHYHLNSSDVTWAEVFGIMEKAKEDFALEDYSVSQITLEQVFLSFARFQHDQS
uniref:ABC transporter domain-containing protein n=1 Tax=Eptatretus burgeri TaxID=7764 RepID=A0A8C4QFV7_EPTBU